MFKRMENNRDNEFSVPAKRPRYDVQRDSMVASSMNNRGSVNKRSGRSDDVWGDDFAEEDIEEMDFVASQACLQVLLAFYSFLRLILFITISVIILGRFRFNSTKCKQTCLACTKI